MTEIKTKRIQAEREAQEQNRWNLLQLRNTWIAVGITVLGISVGAASLQQTSWVAVGILLVLGVLIIVFSRQIATIIFRMESDGLQITDATTGRIIMPNSLKNLATVAAWVLFILGCVCFVFGIANLVSIGFNILSIESPMSIQLVFIGFGILCFILAYIAARIRSKIE